MRRSSSTAVIARIDVATDEGLRRFHRALMLALAQGRLTSGRARILVDLARQEHDFEASRRPREQGWSAQRVSQLFDEAFGKGWRETQSEAESESDET